MRETIVEAPIFTADRSVAFQDVDAAGIVFFVRFFEYCHDVLFAFLGSRGIAMPEVLANGTWGAPLAHVEADYMIPLRFGDRFTVAITEVAIGTSSMRVDYRVSSPREKSVCSAHMVHVFIDRASMRPCPAPEAVREALKDCATFSAEK
ncbi:MAG: thioesterase family protein [Polyangiaceae bacterium]